MRRCQECRREFGSEAVMIDLSSGGYVCAYCWPTYCTMQTERTNKSQQSISQKAAAV